MATTRIRHALPPRAMQRARLDDDGELFADLLDALLDEAAVGLDLGFTGSTEEAIAAALPLKMGPASDQPAPLIRQVRQLHLQAAFARLRAAAEDFQDQPRAIQAPCSSTRARGCAAAPA